MIMLSRSAWLHLRIPFSFFLLPVYLLTVGVSPNLNPQRLLWSFIIIHLFLYPASNGFNSYFDKDKGSIGGLKNPPPVNKGLYYLALLFDGVAIILALWKINLAFASMLLVYGIASKAYSHPNIRIKKYPVGGWLFTGFFQGFFTVWMCHVGINQFDWFDSLTWKTSAVGVLASLMLMGNYPMTQIYQHDEDASRGDYTLSLKLGIIGTFFFTALWFGLAVAGFAGFFYVFYSTAYIYYFLLAMLPVVLYFGWWFLRVYKNRSNANYTYTMWLNLISAVSLNTFFIYFFLDTSNVLSAL
jgi:1,4-dihydroxy-2-naphthoate octaprenyltransferase